ncbi:hypothetical protein [Floridanema aerugineum]|uniref:Uncharacterized protein n=1 Tax=Floridaenema aerugineum BLCC-F46 TaxID=3153654 RepID=A0ABV4X385_9CYAN
MLYTRLSGINFNTATETFKANWLVRAWHIFGFDTSASPSLEEIKRQLKEAQETLGIDLSISLSNFLVVGAEWLTVRKEIERLSLETNWHLVQWVEEYQKYLPRKVSENKPKRFDVLNDLEEIGHHYHLSKLISLAYSIYIYEKPQLIPGLERPQILTDIRHFERLGVVPQISLESHTYILRQELENIVEDLRKLPKRAIVRHSTN